MYADMWMDSLKRLPLDEKYRHPAMGGLGGLFRVHGVVQNTIRSMLNL